MTPQVQSNVQQIAPHTDKVLKHLVGCAFGANMSPSYTRKAHQRKYELLLSLVRNKIKISANNLCTGILQTTTFHKMQTKPMSGRAFFHRPTKPRKQCTETAKPATIIH